MIDLDREYTITTAQRLQLLNALSKAFHHVEGELEHREPTLLATRSTYLDLQKANQLVWALLPHHAEP